MSLAGAFARLERLAGTRGTAVAIGLWAAAEAIVVPIVPDVLVCLLALAAPRQVLRLFGPILVGALVGTLLLAAFLVRAPEAGRTMLLALPGIDEQLLADTRDRVTRDGPIGFAQLGIGPPLKVTTQAWIEIGGDAPGLVAGALINRFTRVGSTVLVAALAGWWFAAWIRRRPGLVLAAYGLAWTAVYVALWT